MDAYTSTSTSCMVKMDLQCYEPVFCGGSDIICEMIWWWFSMRSGHLGAIGGFKGDSVIIFVLFNHLYLRSIKLYLRDSYFIKFWIEIIPKLIRWPPHCHQNQRRAAWMDTPDLGDQPFLARWKHFAWCHLNSRVNDGAGAWL